MVRPGSPSTFVGKQGDGGLTEDAFQSLLIECPAYNNHAAGQLSWHAGCISETPPPDPFMNNIT